jgi:chromosome segregation ATPase
MDAMIINTTDTSSLNALITLALKQTIQAAVQAAIEDRIATLDADLAGIAQHMLTNRAQADAQHAAIEEGLDDLKAAASHVNNSRKEVESVVVRCHEQIRLLEKRCVTALAEREAVELELRDRINKLEKRLDTLSLINTAQEDALNARIQVLEDEVGRLQHANASRDQEREDVLRDLVDTRIDEALADIDLTEQVRNVLVDATITI